MAPIQFGILQFPYQLTDVTGPLDVLSSSSRGYLEAFQPVAGFSKELAERGIDIEFHYVGEDLDKPITSSAGCKILSTTTFDTCPKLDYILVGGPDPNFFMNVPEAHAKFLRERLDEVKTVFTTCTGGCVLATIGLVSLQAPQF